ncbi:hypothetical protein OO009_04690 [Flavobacteriaceae bacterium KMM 6897]|nr:hypothetical protein [Flavobacteriaceae bacterium KMM 6897]
MNYWRTVNIVSASNEVISNNKILVRKEVKPLKHSDTKIHNHIAHIVGLNRNYNLWNITNKIKLKMSAGYGKP